MYNVDTRAKLRKQVYKKKLNHTFSSDIKAFHGDSYEKIYFYLKSQLHANDLNTSMMRERTCLTFDVPSVNHGDC